VKALRSALLLLLCLALCAALCLTAAAEEDSDRAKVYFDGLLSCRGYERNGEIYIPVQALCRFAGTSIGFEGGTPEDVLYYSGSRLRLEIYGKDEYVSANGRYFYAPGGAVEIDGRLCLPADTAARIFSCRAQVDREGGRVDIDTSELAIVTGGIDHYMSLADAEDIFWLARILYAEAGLQGLEGMLAVGQVVFNRMADPRYPNTVFDVVFDREGGQQFTPVQEGSVFYEPSELAKVAAYMCYEGYDLVGDSLYFVNPNAGDSSWFRSNKVYYTTVGLHDFYVDG